VITDESGPAPHEVYTSLLAHELRTPVTSIFAYLQLLSDDRLLNDPDVLRHYLAVVRGRAEGLARIVSELTTFADLIAEGGLPAQGSQPIGVQQLLSELGQGRQLRIEVSDEAVTAAIDLDRLQLVLRQLVDNAFKFGTSGTEVVVRAAVQPEPCRLIVRVTNSGPPIPAQLRGSIFVAYRQAEPPNTRQQGGLGLGLTVARHAAEGAGGSLVLEPGEPTTFRLELPVREDPIARQATALREQAALMDAQALRAVQDMRAARAIAQRERHGRELAEAQQLRVVEDLRTAHDEAVARATNLDTAYLGTISALAGSVEARDSYPAAHVEGVRLHSRRIGDACGMTAAELRQLEFGAVLHDVGKIGVPDQLLQKPGALNPAEWKIMRHHPETGRRMLQGIGWLSDAVAAVGSHHERWDGRGYPEGLAGEAIPLLGRIVAVADAFDAMVTDRPYRAALSMDTALREIERGRGRQFDPDIARLFLADLQTRGGHC
jgi:HD-GYP domain-containing protein (c-di-GMP phosphodiesterase class II)